MRRVIITGAEGFLGRHLARDLRQHGVHVTALGRQPRLESSYFAMGDAPWCPTRLARIIQTTEPDVIFHLVGGVVGSQAELERLNVGVAASLMRALQDVETCPLLVLAGSAAEYGSAVVDGVPVCETATCAPVSTYGATKLAQTRAALAFAEATGTPVLIARIFNPIGPGMPNHLALGEFARQIAMLRGSHGVLQTGDIHVFRDFIDVEHVVTALRRLVQNNDARGVVNVCSGQTTELRRLVGMLIDVSGKDVEIEMIHSRLRPGECRAVVGSTALLTSLGAAPPQTDYADVMARVWHDAETRWATVQ